MLAFAVSFINFLFIIYCYLFIIILFITHLLLETEEWAGKFSTQNFPESKISLEKFRLSWHFQSFI